MKIRQGINLAATLIITAAMTIFAVPASAQGNIQIEGTGAFDGAGVCPGPPDDYSDYVHFTVVLTGDLKGCLYTKTALDSRKFTPSGVYRERGSEVIEACLDLDGNSECDGGYGLLETTYHFTAKFDAEGNQVFGRCQHPIVWGDGIFADATGRLDFKDNIVNGVAEDFDFRGHIKPANGR